MDNLIVDRKAAKRHDRKLKSLLFTFFDFLNKKPKPSDEEVRSEFLKREMAWKTYCILNHLDIRTSLMFNAKVSYEWESKFAQKRNIQTEN